MKNNKILILMGWIISILIPFILIMTAVRILITPLFPRLEYGMPGFPEDQFGFSMEDRLKWSEPSIKYLINKEDITYLEALKFEDGTNIYNDRELSHMKDVKELVQVMIKIWLAGLAIVLLLILFLDGSKKRDVLRKGLSRGGWFSVFLIVTMLLFVALSFNQLFNWFHYLFFAGGTWLFFETDTLIRLFPLRFWQDAFIFVGTFTLLAGLLLIFLFRIRVIKTKTSSF